MGLISKSRKVHELAKTPATYGLLLVAPPEPDVDRKAAMMNEVGMIRAYRFLQEKVLSNPQQTEHTKRHRTRTDGVQKKNGETKEKKKMTSM